MAINSVSQTSAAATGLGKASGSKDSALVDIYKSLTDESGRVSDEEKLAAYRKLSDLSQSTDSKNPYGYAGYSNEDIQLLSKINAQTSSFVRQQNALVEKQSKFADELVRSGKSGSAGVQAQIDFYDSLSSFEKANFDGDYRDNLVAIKKIFQKLEEREAAGAYKSGTPLDQVTDPEARTALLLLEGINSRDPAFQASAREQANDLKVGGYGSIQDKVDLSAAAKSYLSQS